MYQSNELDGFRWPCSNWVLLPVCEMGTNITWEHCGRNNRDVKAPSTRTVLVLWVNHMALVEYVKVKKGKVSLAPHPSPILSPVSSESTLNTITVHFLHVAAMM